MPTILVVDDAAFMRMRMSKILSEAGYTVIQAENGIDAVAKYKVSHPDAVLMDITMPEMDGLTALKEIRAHDPNARVAMVTRTRATAGRAGGGEERREGLPGQALRG